MKSNILAFFLSIGSIALAVLIVWFYNMSDKDAPEMRFMAMDLIYDSSTTESNLLGGVVAYDGVDGDITDRIVVEKTILDEEQGTAVVYYAVSDLSGNVAKQSRVFPADIEDLKGENEDLFNSEEGGLFPEGFAAEEDSGEGESSDEQEEGEESAATSEGVSAGGTASGNSAAENGTTGN